MEYTYKTRGVCSRSITFTIENNIVQKVSFQGGCNGNAQGVAALVAGMDADDAIRRLKGIACGSKNTSCPDQLALALQEAKEKCAEAEQAQQ